MQALLLQGGGSSGSARAVSFVVRWGRAVLGVGAAMHGAIGAKGAGAGASRETARSRWSESSGRG